MNVAKFFLNKAHVAVVPGVAFNYPDHIRFVFAKSIEEIKEGLDRIEKIIKELKPFLIKTGLMSLYCCDLIVLPELGNRWLLVRDGCYMSSGILVNIIDYKELSWVLKA